MLATLNQLAHGYVGVPVILACRRAGLFSRLSGVGENFNALAKSLHANAGHLRATLRMLESLGWVSRSADNSYHWTDEGNLQQIPDDVGSLLGFAFEPCVQDSPDPSDHGVLSRRHRPLRRKFVPPLAARGGVVG